MGGGQFNPNAFSIFTVDSTSSCWIQGFALTQGYAGAGGAIYNTGSVTVTDCLIYGNTAGLGGGLANAGTSMVIANSIVENNLAFAKGGGIYNSSGSNLSLTSCGILSNQAGAGGGIYNFGTVTNISGSSNISYNSASSGSGYGGGVYNLGQFTMNSGTIGNNAATDNGGGFYQAINPAGPASANLTGVSISNNTAGNAGGGFGLLDGTLTLDGCTVKGNIATEIPASNGGLVITGSTYNPLANCTITDAIKNQ